MRIPATYHDGNPEDRNYALDFWAWLQEQPQQAWLYYARRANWDQAEDTFVKMVRRPDCDRALASWLFWSGNPDYWIENGERPGADTLVGAILDRCEGGGFAEAQLHYRRVEVALRALRIARALAGRDGSAPFRIPRELCASFEGTNPDLPAYDAETEQDLAAIFAYLDGGLHRTDRASLDAVSGGGNWWFEPALRLPTNPRTDQAMSDVEAIDAVFGEHRASLQRIELVRQARQEQREAASRKRARRELAQRHAVANPRQRAIGIGILVVSALLLLALVAGNLLR